MFETLDAVLADAAAHLTRAARDRKSPMHVPVVGTGDGDLRMMVLRACDPDIGLLRFHTDARSPKARQLGSHAVASVLAFDAEAKIQLRVKGYARIECAGPVADAAWAASSPYARRCYLAVAAPGSPAERPMSGLPEITVTVPSGATARERTCVSSSSWYCASAAPGGLRKMRPSLPVPT